MQNVEKFWIKKSVIGILFLTLWSRFLSEEYVVMWSSKLIVWNRKFNYSVYKGSALPFILSHVSQVHTLVL